MGTSRALPMPKPAWPCASPTTTNAEKLRFFPPFTTLVTRLMATTCSFSELGLASTGWRTASLSLSMCLDMSLEFQPRFAGRIGQRLYPPVILVAAAVEHHLGDAGLQRAFGRDLPHHLRRGHVSPGLDLLRRFFVVRARGAERASSRVVDDLHADVPQRAVHAEARALRCSLHTAPQAVMDPLAMRVA